ncbi:hypothetical protein SVI_4283 [Shewanella violacea DSS12]|uniref:Uncharacterized protein n=1 Tax=Shewanella violacea (strain JCM 10179 / CIP 106290 / LMG 19151 / DSS12) TaxID=637905 RepID=D4ZF90_SHEVD|nr:hypothetical protein SVI_4283 [Shewanella violacea DSS12]
MAGIAKLLDACALGSLVSRVSRLEIARQGI